MTEQLMYAEINVINILIMGIIALRALGSGQGKNTCGRLFIAAVLFALLSNVLDSAWNLSVTENWMFPAWARYTVNFIYFISLGCASCCWLLYTDIVQDSRAIKNKKMRWFYSIPILTLAVLLTVNVFNGCLYYIDADGVYHRGNLFYFQHILSYGYAVCASLKSFVNAMHKGNFANRDYFLTMTAFVIPPVICGIIQAIVQNIPILSVGIMISFLLAYLNSNETLISVDPLTGISNRRDFLRHISDDIRSLKSDEKMYLAFLDVDNFKKINDTYGHNEGDRVLKDVASALKAYTKNKNAYCARYGGDEFAAICITEKEEESPFCELVNVIEEKSIFSGESNVKISMGSTEFYGEDDSIPDMIARADKAMYAMKRINKK